MSKLLVFEGLDGCGKGTQMLLAASFLFELNKEINLYLTREPTKDFKEIRAKLSTSTDVNKDGEWYAQMFVADRKHHLQHYILPNLERGIEVLSDRYKHSTLAYQQTQGIDLNYLLQLHQGLLIPDLTLIFDCPAETAFTRRGKAGATDVFDKDLQFQENLRKNYLHLSQSLPGEKIVIIDGSRTIEETFAQVKTELKIIYQN